MGNPKTNGWPLRMAVLVILGIAGWWGNGVSTTLADVSDRLARVETALQVHSP